MCPDSCPVQRVLIEMPWRRKRRWPDSPCSGRTDSICDSEPDVSHLNEDVEGNYCFLGMSGSFQPPQMLIFSQGWIPKTCLSRHTWLAVRALASYEAGILSLFVVLRKTRRDRDTPIQLQDMLQELLFIESGAPQSWLGRSELLAASTAAVYEHRHLPTLHLGKNLGTRCNEEGALQCCNGRSSRERQTLPDSMSRARTYNSRQLGGWNLALPRRLAGNTDGSGIREGPVAASPRLARRGEVQFDFPRPLRRSRNRIAQLVTEHAASRFKMSLVVRVFDKSEVQRAFWGRAVCL